MKKIILIGFIGLVLAACTSSKTATIDNATSDSNKEISWFASSSLSDVQAQASNKGKPIFIDLSASWCGYCKKMKKNVYSDEGISQALNSGYIPVSLDGEVGNGKELYTRLNLKGFPTQVIMDAKGNILKQNTGYLSDKELLAFISK